MIWQTVTDSNGNIVCGLVNEHGKVISRTPQEYPYSYDGYVTHRLQENSKDDNTVCTDRLWQRNPKLHDELCQKHFGDKGQYWGGRYPEQIEAFLRDYYKNPDIELVYIMQYCNVSSGYPLWRLEYKLKK